MILGDCSIALDASNINPLKFFDTLKNFHGNIKFTMNQHKRQILSATLFGWKYFRKILIRRNVFHLTFVILNNAKIIYLLHLLDEFEPQQKTFRMNIYLQKVLYLQEHPQNQEAIPRSYFKSNKYPIENPRRPKVETDGNNLPFVTTFNPNNKIVIQRVFKLLTIK